MTGRVLTSSRTALAAALASLMLSGSALAQDRQEHHGEMHPQGAHAPAPAHAPPARPGGWTVHPDGQGNQPGGYPPMMPRPGAAPGLPPSPVQPDGFHGAPGGNAQRWEHQGRNPGADRGWHGAVRGRGWDHGWRNDPRYDWQGWRTENRGVFRMGPYRPPYRGWYYRRLTIGFVLAPMFFAQSYWIGDPWYYHLPPAYPPYQWVRYYDDALLIDTSTGQVVDVLYDVFW